MTTPQNDKSMHTDMLVKRVARALWHDHAMQYADVPLEDWSRVEEPYLASFLRSARAALDAIKQPEYLRWCEWPGCLRAFNVLTGPKPETDGKGWIYVRTGMHVLLCPDHADTGHRPQHFEWESGDTTIRTSCECGERSGDLTPTSNARCTEWWREHVQAVSA